MSKVESLRAAHHAAVERLHASQRAIDEADAEDESVDLDALSEEFDTAAAEVERCSENLAKAEKRAKLVEDNPLPAAAEEAPAPIIEERGKPARVEITRHEMTYDRHKDVSYFQDLYLSQKLSDPMATERLARHRREMVDHLKKERGLREFRAINETAGTGGEFVPPLWLNQQYIEYLRAARATADVVNHMPLPEHTNSINFPSLTGGSTTAAQADGGSVSSTDVTTSSVTVPVKTIAGQQDMARQLLERSVPGMDQVLMQDLMADYNKQLDTQVINGSGSGANATGILNTSSIGSVTYTDASPAFGGDGKLAAQLGNAINTVATNRFLPPDCIVMHPRRWYWIVSRSDSQNRPLVVPEGQAVNAVGIADRVVAQARAGTLFGLPVILDPNVPTNVSSTQDPILVLRAQDIWLMEDAAGPYTRVYEEVLSGTLSIRVQLFNYMAFTAARYPSSVCKVTGTGVTTPTY